MTAICPVCGCDRSSALLSLPGQPIYQHPVPANVEVAEPHTVDLSWVACNDCAHAWQPAFDPGLLERIYRSHYYTPTPDGIAVQFRNDFLAILEKFEMLGPKRVLLEIGASNGDVLQELRLRTGASCAYAFEPNRENAAVARQRGLDVREQFFGAAVARERVEPVELIYARHVIEHVFQFDDFFAGLDTIAAPRADLIFETPSLDHHAGQNSTTPFHIEHVHVFSLRSLTRLSLLHGWALIQSEVTADGNLIAAFRPAELTADRTASETPAPDLAGLQMAVATRRSRLRDLVAGRPLIFWGAGSAAVGLVGTIGREPELWTDGNPNKIGKKFVGLKRQIASPEHALTQGRRLAKDGPLLVIASSFAREILPRVRALGWDGEVLDLAGNRL